MYGYSTVGNPYLTNWLNASDVSINCAGIRFLCKCKHLIFSGIYSVFSSMSATDDVVFMACKTYSIAGEIFAVLSNSLEQTNHFHNIAITIMHGICCIGNFECKLLEVDFFFLKLIARHQLLSSKVMVCKIIGKYKFYVY